jgi:HEAT repeats
VSDPVVRATATLSLARLAAPGARRAVAEALVSPDPELVAAGARAACMLSTERVPSVARAWPVPEGRVDARALLRQLLPDPCSPDARADAALLLAPEISEAVSRAVRGSALQVRSVTAALLDADGHAAFLPLTAELGTAERTRAERAREAAERIARGVLPAFLQLLAHPSPELRQSSLAFLGSRPEPAARQALLAALEDTDPTVQRSALGALSLRPDVTAALAVAQLLAQSDRWPLRRQAAQALEQLGGVADAPRVLETLTTAAQKDRYALVRDAAARALFAISPRAALPVLEHLRDSDPEAQVQASARELLNGPAGKSPTAGTPSVNGSAP